MDSRETSIYIAVIITVVIVSIILGYFALILLRQQKRALSLQKDMALAEISAMEKERERIATDLHDEVGPVLSTIKFRINHVLYEGLAGIDELNIACQQVDELTIRMREVASNLMPTALHRKGLLAAVDEFLRHVTNSTGIVVSFQPQVQSRINISQSIHIYRIIQELVNNSMKHANATHLEVELSEENSFLRILCRDNGDGFDTDAEANKFEGIGLTSIKNRVLLMSGTFLIESKKEIGTAVLIKIPMQ